jgi:hypothetical protein
MKVKAALLRANRAVRAAARELGLIQAKPTPSSVKDVYKKVRNVAADASGRLQDLADELAMAGHAKDATAADKERLRALRGQVERADELVFNIGTGILDVE